MINELYSSMHELLDYIITHYNEADDDEREDFCRTVQELKENNDSLMDEYVSFEEKLVQFFDLYRESLDKACDSKGTDTNHSMQHLPEMQTVAAKPYGSLQAIACNECDLFLSPDHEQFLDQAQGYYKLFMFANSARILHAILVEQPECNIARIYYGMSLMHLRNWSEAQRQFQLLTVLSDFPKWLALSYNALGCIQAIKLNMNQAELLFRKAYQIYPEFEDPLKNLKSCIESPKELALYFGSTELCPM